MHSLSLSLLLMKCTNSLKHLYILEVDCQTFLACCCDILEFNSRLYYTSLLFWYQRIKVSYRQTAHLTCWIIFKCSFLTIALLNSMSYCLYLFLNVLLLLFYINWMLFTSISQRLVFFLHSKSQNEMPTIFVSTLSFVFVRTSLVLKCYDEHISRKLTYLNIDSNFSK